MGLEDDGFVESDEEKFTKPKVIHFTFFSIVLQTHVVLRGRMQSTKPSKSFATTSEAAS